MSIPLPQQRLWLCLGILVLLLPFVGKAFHIDDPIFLWTAEQVAEHPADFLGFEVNWYGTTEPMSEVNKNPPLVGYYLAAIATLAGWSELALHIGMLLPALALALGCHRLAQRFCDEPLVATLVAVATPVFMLSATSLMSDVPMLALWCWALVFFLRGLDDHRLSDFACAGVLMALCALSKYFGLALIPLVIAYSLAREKRAGPWLLSIAIVFVVVAAYDLYLRALYDFDPLLDVAGFATENVGEQGVGLFERGAIGLFFLGGCSLGGLFFAPWIWSARALALGAAGISIATFGLLQVVSSHGFGSDIELQQGIFAVAGLHLAALALWDLWKRRDADSLLLNFWLVGVFAFAAFTNWTTNGRALLPVIPVVGILVARALQTQGETTPLRWIPGVAVGFALALWVTVADVKLADAGRTAAHDVVKMFSPGGRTQLYFQGSWGFQRYMELAGFERLDAGKTKLRIGDRVVTAQNNSNVIQMPEEWTELEGELRIPISNWLSIMSLERSAGYHASLWGSLPYSFGPTAPETYRVFSMTRNWDIVRSDGLGPSPQPRAYERPKPATER